MEYHLTLPVSSEDIKKLHVGDIIFVSGSIFTARDEAHLMIWGPSARVLAQNSELQKMVKTVQESGVDTSACVVCSDDYGVSEKLESLGVKTTHTGELLTEALQNDWKVITF